MHRGGRSAGRPCGWLPSWRLRRKDLRRDLRRLSRNELVAIANGEHTPQIVIGMNELGVFTRRAEDHDGVVAAGGAARFILWCHAMAPRVSCPLSVRLVWPGGALPRSAQGPGSLAPQSACG